MFKDNLNRQGAGAGAGLSYIYASLGQYAEAADVLVPALARGPQETRDFVANVIRLLRSAPSKAAAPETLPNLYGGSFVFLYIGAPERALEVYEEGRTIPAEIGLLWHPSYAPARKTERFKTLVRNLALYDYWKAKGWPAQCRPVGADDFECE